MRANPCKDCAKRYVGCHADCGDYLKWRADRDEALVALYNERTNAYELRAKAQKEQSRRKLAKRGYKTYR